MLIQIKSRVEVLPKRYNLQKKLNNVNMNTWTCLHIHSRDQSRQNLARQAYLWFYHKNSFNKTGPFTKLHYIKKSFSLINSVKMFNIRQNKLILKWTLAEGFIEVIISKFLVWIWETVFHLSWQNLIFHKKNNFTKNNFLQNRPQKTCIKHYIQYNPCI